MTSAAPFAAASAKHEQPSEYQQQQGAALCDVAVTTAAAAVAASSCTVDATVRDAVLDWAKSLTTEAFASTFLPSDDSSAGASSNTSYTADGDGSTSSKKKRKNNPGDTSSPSPRTTMITPPLMVFPSEQSSADSDIDAAVAAASAAATAAYLSMAIQASSASPSNPPTKKMKRWGGVVQRTHSPRSNKSTIISRPGCTDSPVMNVQLITPTVEGIQQVAHHLLSCSSSIVARDGGLGNMLTVPSLTASNPVVSAGQHRHRLVALPTECTYEVTTLIDWNKSQPLSSAEHSLRVDQLRHLQSAASASSKFRKMKSASLHICLPHDNIRLIDRLFDFPKRAYAVKQNPQGGCYTLNESRIVFQRLADHFWPGPVMIYLAVPPLSANTEKEKQDITEASQQYVPRALLHESPTSDNSSDKQSQTRYVGFRCPSHPLSVKVLRHISHATRSKSSSTATSPSKEGGSITSTSTNRKVLISSPVVASASLMASSSPGHPGKKKSIPKKGCPLSLHAKDVAQQMSVQFQPKESSSTSSLPRVQILHGEEKREMFTVPTCQFQDEWMECWVVQSTRTLIIRGKSRRQIPSLATLLRINSSSSPSAMTSPPTSPRSSHNSRVVRSVLGQWKIDDQRVMTAPVPDASSGSGATSESAP